jgi:hypothetical protein
MSEHIVMYTNMDFFPHLGAAKKARTREAMMQRPAAADGKSGYQHRNYSAV